MLDTNVRYRVGVISTTSGFGALIAAVDPKPTTKRNSENSSHEPSGIAAHPAAPSEKISPPPQMIFWSSDHIGDLSADQRARDGADAG